MRWSFSYCMHSQANGWSFWPCKFFVWTSLGSAFQEASHGLSALWESASWPRPSWERPAWPDTQWAQAQSYDIQRPTAPWLCRVCGLQRFLSRWPMKRRSCILCRFAVWDSLKRWSRKRRSFFSVDLQCGTHLRDGRWRWDQLFCCADLQCGTHLRDGGWWGDQPFCWHLQCGTHLRDGRCRGDHFLSHCGWRGDHFLIVCIVIGARSQQMKFLTV